MPAAVALLAALAVGLLGLVAGVRRLNRTQDVGEAVIADPEDHTTVDARGAVRSVQAADLTVPVSEAERIWDAHHLERLARTYWRFLTRATLGIIRVSYDETGRYVCLFGLRPLTLLSFHPPEYELDAHHGIVRWRIRRGVLVATPGREQDGYLEIDVERCEDTEEGLARLHIEIEVANFYPWLASGLAMWVYQATQSRIHVIVTHGFLRSLARLELAESRTRRFPPGVGTPVAAPGPERRRSRSSAGRGR